MKIAFLLTIVTALLTSRGTEALDRAQFNRSFTGISGPLTKRSILKDISTAAESKLSGMRYVKPVLDGVLYRGGGSGGEVPLDDGELQALCDAGFSAVDFAYEGQDPQQVDCNGNSLIYQSVPNRPNAASSKIFLSHVYHSIVNGAGPVMVHCWNGWHESGLMSAYALMQFCGWSGSDAGSYWQSTLGDNMQPAYFAVLKEINQFVPIPELTITSAQAAVICPQ